MLVSRSFHRSARGARACGSSDLFHRSARPSGLASHCHGAARLALPYLDHFTARLVALVPAAILDHFTARLAVPSTAHLALPLARLMASLSARVIKVRATRRRYSALACRSACGSSLLAAARAASSISATVGTRPSSVASAAAAHGAADADRRVADELQAGGEQGKSTVDRALEMALAHERPHPQRSVRLRHAIESRDPVDVDEHCGTSESEVQHGGQALAAGQN